MMIEYFGQHWVKLLCASAITLGNTVYYVAPQDRIKNSLRWHEQTHIEQYNELGFMKFFGTYIGEYMLNLAKGYNLIDAKLNISLELEATESEKACGTRCTRSN